jgi:hypothetical protein
MSERLDPVFRTTFRHAEPLDTRLGIRRDEPQEDSGRRRDRDEKRGTTDPWQDITSVSIPALRAFLSELLGEAPAASAAVEAPPPADMPSRAPDPVAARAAGAYRATARGTLATPPPSSPVTTNDQPHEAGHPALSDAERRAIRLLIADIDRLAARGVDQLTIEKNGSFLDSLAAAARKALQ